MSIPTVKITSEGLLHNTHVYVGDEELRVSAIDIHIDADNSVTATLKVYTPNLDIEVLEKSTKLIIEDLRGEPNSN